MRGKDNAGIQTEELAKHMNVFANAAIEVARYGHGRGCGKIQV